MLNYQTSLAKLRIPVRCPPRENKKKMSSSVVEPVAVTSRSIFRIFLTESFYPNSKSKYIERENKQVFLCFQESVVLWFFVFAQKTLLNR